MHRSNQFALIAVTALGCGSSDGGVATAPLTLGDAGTADSSTADGGVESTATGAACKTAPPATRLGAQDLCQHQTTALASLNTQSPLGFSASDLLSLAGQEYTVPFSWETDEFAPEAPSDTLKIAITPRDSTARYQQNTPDPMFTGLMASCISAVEVDVRVELTSTGGALNESFDTVLHGESANLASVPTFLVPSLDLHGALALTPAICRTSLRLSGLVLSLDFSTSGMTGQIGAQLADRDTVQTVTLARLSSQP